MDRIAAEIIQLRDSIRAELHLTRKMSVERLRDEYKAGQMLAAYMARGRPKKGSPRDLLLKELGLTKTERNRWTTLAAIPEHIFEARLRQAEDRSEVAARRGDELTRNSLLRLGREHKRKTEEAVPRTGRLGTRCALHVGDIRDGLPFIGDASLDAIITDPPYDKASVPLLETLSEVAHRTLKPGGICAALVGNLFLPEKITALAKHLDWFLEVAYCLPQPIRQPTGGTVHFVEAVPVLLFTNGKRRQGIRTNVVQADRGCDRQWHKFGQCSVGFQRLVELVTSPGDLVCDPFNGGGTTGHACMQSGRSFIGCDIDSNAINTTLLRLGMP